MLTLAAPAAGDGEMDVVIVNAVGTAAALCSMTSFVPQIVKILKDKDASAVSLKMFAVTVTGFVLWTIYGVMLGSWPVAVSNAVNLVLSAVILALKWRYPGDGEPSR